MSDKKTLLEEGTIRRFMKLANMEALGTGFVNEMYGKGTMKNDDDDLDEGQRTQKPMADDDEREEKKKPMEEEVDLEEKMHDKDEDKKKMEEDVDLEETGAPAMADDDDPVKEMMGGDMKDDAMADDMEMDLDVKDEEEEMDMDAGDMGELTLTDEEAEVFLKVADKVRAAMEMDSPAEELPAPDMGDMDEPMDEPMDDEPMMEEDMVNEIARRVARRLSEMKKSK